MGVWSTRWLFQAVGVVTPDRPSWRVGDQVTLTLEPYQPEGDGPLTRALSRLGAFDGKKGS